MYEANDALNGSAGGGAGDPSYWGSLVSGGRPFGRSVFIDCTPADSTLIDLGFDSNQVASIFDCIRLFSTVIINESGAGGFSVGAYSSAVNYKICLVMRSATTKGFYAFITGGAFIFWTPVWISVSSSNTTLYPSIHFRGRTNQVLFASLTFYFIPSRFYSIPTGAGMVLLGLLNLSALMVR